MHLLQTNFILVNIKPLFKSHGCSLSDTYKFLCLGLFDALKQITRTEGLRGLYSG